MSDTIKELQIEIDDVYSCGGKCPGCVLSDDERKVYQPDMAPNVFDTVTSSVFNYMKLMRENDRANRVNITYGIGDHFRMSEDYLRHIILRAKGMISKAGYLDGFSSVFVSTSMIDTMSVIKSRIDIMAEQDGAVPVIPLVVFDPLKIHTTYSDNYVEGILYARDKFKRIDLSINLSDEVISILSPTELFDFAKRHGFEDVTINWVPSIYNIKATTGKTEELTKWLIDFHLIIKGTGIETSYVPVLERLIKNFNIDTTRTDIISGIKETVQRSIQVDHEGVLFPKMEGIGDVPHNNRTGFPTYGLISADTDIEDKINSNIHKTIVSVMEAHMKNRACLSCHNINRCMMSGFHAYVKVSQGSDDKCPCPAFDLIESVVNT